MYSCTSSRAVALLKQWYATSHSFLFFPPFFNWTWFIKFTEQGLNGSLAVPQAVFHKITRRSWSLVFNLGQMFCILQCCNLHFRRTSKRKHNYLQVPNFPIFLKAVPCSMWQSLQFTYACVCYIRIVEVCSIHAGQLWPPCSVNMCRMLITFLKALTASSGYMWASGALVRDL